MNKNKEYLCPICNSPLTLAQGGHRTTEGVTLYCQNSQCSAAEVFGHSRNEEGAYKIVTDKYKKSIDF